MSESFSLHNEQDARSEVLNVLAGLEGYQKMTPKQQQMLRVSLYTTDRANRPATTELRERRNILDPIIVKSSGTEEYKKSQKHMSRWYCSAAVKALEEEEPLPEKPKLIGASYFKAEYTHPETLAALEEQIEQCGYPCVVHIRDTQRPGFFSPRLHSFVALGKENGQTMIWEKENVGRSYNLRPLSEVHAFYKQYAKEPLYWGMRPLRHSGR